VLRRSCGVVSNGGTVARSTDGLAGPVAALADLQTVNHRGALSACHEITITHLSGSVGHFDTCP